MKRAICVIFSRLKVVGLHGEGAQKDLGSNPLAYLLQMRGVKVLIETDIRFRLWKLT